MKQETKPKPQQAEFDYIELSKRIYQKFGHLDAFCDAAQIKFVDFIDYLGTGRPMPPDIIMTASKLLDILPDEIGFYFYCPVPDDWRRNPGRPTKEIKKTTTPPKHVHYYTISEAADLLGVHRHTLQDRLRKGTIKGKLIGRSWRIYRDEIFDNSTHLYFFDCNDAVFGNKYLTPGECNQLENDKNETIKEAEIIELAKKLDATLYRYDCDQKNGVCIFG